MAAPRFIRSLTEAIMLSKNLIFLDLSWSRLFPKDLATLSGVLSNGAWSLRNLNLSYNKLEFSQRSQDRMYSQLFMDNIEKFFWEALFINHVNFSGMNLNEEQVKRMLDIFKQC